MAEKFECTACGFSGSKRAVSTHISQRSDDKHGNERGHFEGYKDLIQPVETDTDGSEEGTATDPEPEPDSGTTVETNRTESKDGEGETDSDPDGDSGNGLLSLLEKYGILEL